MVVSRNRGDPNTESQMPPYEWNLQKHIQTKGNPQVIPVRFLDFQLTVQARGRGIVVQAYNRLLFMVWGLRLGKEAPNGNNWAYFMDWRYYLPNY